MVQENKKRNRNRNKNKNKGGNNPAEAAPAAEAPPAGAAAAAPAPAAAAPPPAEPAPAPAAPEPVAAAAAAPAKEELVNGDDGGQSPAERRAELIKNLAKDFGGNNNFLELREAERKYALMAQGKKVGKRKQLRSWQMLNEVLNRFGFRTMMDPRRRRSRQRPRQARNKPSSPRGARASLPTSPR